MGLGSGNELPGIFAQALSTREERGYRRSDSFRRWLPHILKVNDLRGGTQNISVTEVHASSFR